MGGRAAPYVTRRRSVSITIMPPWLAASQRFWESFIYENCLTSRDWFRVWAAAMARCDANLHAQFARGELAYLLGRKVEGEHVPMTSTRLSNLIKELRDRGLLAAGSGQRCLVLPAGHFDCDLPGKAKPCAWHHQRVSRPKRTFVARPKDETQRGAPTRNGVYAVQRSSGVAVIHSANESDSFSESILADKVAEATA